MISSTPAGSSLHNIIHGSPGAIVLFPRFPREKEEEHSIETEEFENPWLWTRSETPMLAERARVDETLAKLTASDGFRIDRGLGGEFSERKAKLQAGMTFASVMHEARKVVLLALRTIEEKSEQLRLTTTQPDTSESPDPDSRRSTTSMEFLLVCYKAPNASGTSLGGVGIYENVFQ